MSGPCDCPLSLVESKTILADTDTVDFLALTSEFDGYYFLDATTIKGAGGSVIVSLQPNADAANGLVQSLTWGTALAPVQGSAASMNIYGSGGAIGESQRGQITFYPKVTGLPRQGMTEQMESSVAMNSIYRIVAAISYMDVVTPITSLRLKASVANGIKAGSVYTLYKVSPSP